MLLEHGARRRAARRRRRGHERGALPRVPEARRAGREPAVTGVLLGEGRPGHAGAGGAARARGAEVLAEVTGYGTAFVPPERESSLVHPSARGAWSARSRDALADAGHRAASDVDVVVSGVAGCPRVRRGRARAPSRGPRRRGSPSLAPKLAWARRSARAGRWDGCGARVALQARAPAAIRCAARSHLRTAPRTVLVTSLGYYGNASALVMRALRARRTASCKAARP